VSGNTNSGSGSSTEAIRKAGLDRVEGIIEAGFCPAAGQVHLVFDPNRITDEEIIRQARRLEPYLRQRFDRCLFTLDGQACEACALKLEKKAESIPGVRHASASFIGGVMSVQFDQQQIAERELLHQLRDQGMPLKPWIHRPQRKNPLARLFSWLTIRPLETALTFGTLLLIIAGWWAGRISAPTWVPFLCFAGAYITGGIHGVQSAWNSLRRRTMDVDLLMMLAALGAAYVGAPVEGGILLFLFSLSHLLQHGAIDHARSAIHALMKLRPDRALVRRHGELVLLPIDSLQIDDVVIVRPGECVPLDGQILQGESALDESTLTGESMPVNKMRGDPVFAGTINTSGGLEVRVTRLARDSAIARLIKMVEFAQSEKAKTQRFLDHAEQYYAAGVILLTIGLVVFPLLFGSGSFDDIFYRAMTVMVVASPCALIISTPASILSAIGGAARNGVLFKGGLHLERAAEIRVVAFDKTGTLTMGKPAVTDLITREGVCDPKKALPRSAASLVTTAASVEAKSEHPLAKAIVEYARTAGIPVDPCESFQAIPGQGVKGTVGGRVIFLGDPRMFNGDPVSGRALFADALMQLQSEGKTVMLVVEQPAGGAARELVGLIGLADQLRPDAAAVISDLKRAGIDRVVMLTGDHRNVAETIGRQAGVDEVHAELLPEDKWRIIQSLKESGPVAMVGDGINDAPALASADIGVAMGAAGTDVAMETADIVLMGDQLKTIAYAFSISRAARRIVIQNLSFAMGVIAVLMVGALGYELPLPIGVIGHEGSTVIVCLNGLRLLRHRQP